MIFEVDHREEGETTSRQEVRENLAQHLKSKVDLVFIEKVITKTGTMTALGEANAYETLDQAKLVEQAHIITRNTPPEKPVVEKPVEKPSEEEATESESLTEKHIEDTSPEKAKPKLKEAKSEVGDEANKEKKGISEKSENAEKLEE